MVRLSSIIEFAIIHLLFWDSTIQHIEYICSFVLQDRISVTFEVFVAIRFWAVVFTV